MLQRDKFSRYVTAAEREEFLVALVDRVDFLEPAEVVRACRDPRDDKFLELAICGQAATIISGDQDLLALHPFRGIAILTPADFRKATQEQVVD